MVYPINKWFQWVTEQPWSFRWFIYLVLLRPIIDRSWKLKDPVFHLSLLDFIGIIVPMVIIFLLAGRHLPRYEFKRPDKLFLASGLIILVNLAFFFTNRTTLLWFGIILKTLLPFLIYFYLRHWITLQRNLHGLLTTFAYSCLFPLLLFIFESIQNQNPSDWSRGLERYSGGYADIFNYSIYFIFIFVIFGYSGLLHRKSSLILKDIQIGIITLLIVFVLFRIHHMTSLLVFLVIFSLYLGFRIAQGRIISTLVMLHLFVFACFFLQLQSHIDPLVKNEIAVLKGEKNIKHAFHGRMQRWQKMINEFNQSALPYQIMNPSFAKLRSYGYMISGSHNDYLRILFLGGFLGLFLYLGFLYSIALGWSRLHFARKFLNTSILLILLLFSITAVPTVYAPMMYITMIVFSYSVYRK